MFESKGTITEEIAGNLKPYLIPGGRKMLFLIIILLSAILGIVEILLKNYSMATVFFAAVLVFTIEYFLTVRKFYRLFMLRIQEVTGKRAVVYQTSFTDSGMHVQNLDTGAEGNFEYSAFTVFFETPDVFALITKGNQMAFVFKDCLNEQQMQDFKPYLKEKCPILKIR